MARYAKQTIENNAVECMILSVIKDNGLAGEKPLHILIPLVVGSLQPFAEYNFKYMRSMIFCCEVSFL
jgi:hypothetical protein